MIIDMRSVCLNNEGERERERRGGSECGLWAVGRGHIAIIARVES